MNFLEKIAHALNNNPFKGFFKKNRLRPPGAVDEKKFMQLCIRCGRCIAVCTYESIVRADAMEKLQIGTPFIHAEEKACYLCMQCPTVCPTGALDPKVTEMTQVRMGVAIIDEERCLNHIYAKDEARGATDGTALYCGTCYNVCPLQGKAIVLKDHIIPIITDECVGCGICTERCPLTPRAVNILPTGMADSERTGLYHIRNKTSLTVDSEGNLLHGEELLKHKNSLKSDATEKELEYKFNTDTKLDGWD